jgi:hypothetical protein
MTKTEMFRFIGSLLIYWTIWNTTAALLWSVKEFLLKGSPDTLSHLILWQMWLLPQVCWWGFIGYVPLVFALLHCASLERLWRADRHRVVRISVGIGLLSGVLLVVFFVLFLAPEEILTPERVIRRGDTLWLGVVLRDFGWVLLVSSVLTGYSVGFFWRYFRMEEDANG